MGKANRLKYWIEADWEAPDRVRAGISTRQGGHSLPPYDSLNLAHHVGDDPQTVDANRQLLKRFLGLPSEPVWLSQVHGNRIIAKYDSGNLEADGIYTEEPGRVCVIMTADCVPVLICNRQGGKIAAVHAGWRGFCAGIIHSALDLFDDKPDDILIWIGPHIEAGNYEVGEDVYQACTDRDKSLSVAFSKNTNGRWNASLKTMIYRELENREIRNISCADLCTYDQSADFFSYRREKTTGRMASMIWIDK